MTKLLFRVLRTGVVIALAHIVAHNFPGRSVGYAHPELRRRGAEGRSTASTLRFVSNTHFRVVYPQSLDVEQAERVLNILESGRAELLHRVSSAGIQSSSNHSQYSSDEEFWKQPCAMNSYMYSLIQSAAASAAYAAAYNIVKQLMRVEGENKVWKRVADRSYSVRAAVVPALTT